MNDPYQAIIDGKPTRDVLRMAIAASPTDLEASVDALADDYIESGLKQWAELRIGSSQTNHFVFTGGVLYLYREATERRDWADHFAALRERIGFSQSKAYAAILAFTHFGEAILADPRLAQRFRMTSLAVLTSKRATNEAREEALHSAQIGQTITEKLAKRIVADHQDEPQESEPRDAAAVARSTPLTLEGPVEPDGPAALVPPSEPVELFSHTSDGLRFVVLADGPVSLGSVLVQHTIQEAMDRLREACEAANRSVSEEGAHV